MSGNPNGPTRDQEIVAEFLCTREERAFRELYRRHAPSLNQLLVHLVGALDGEVEDVIQATWIRAIEHLSDFRWESTLRTWLTGIAINCSREFLRKRKRVQSREMVENVEGSQPARMNQRINLIDLERVIGNLPDGYREVLILHDVEGYTHGEISGFLGIEEGTSKSQLSRARKAVRIMLTSMDGYQHEHDERSEQRPDERRAGGISLVS